MRNELLNAEVFYTLEEANLLIREWVEHYNTGRPHGALKNQTPIEFRRAWKATEADKRSTA